MIEFEANHHQVVATSLAEDAVADENTMASLAILSERLDRVKQLGGAFAGIGFSSAVKELQASNSAVAVM